MAIQTKYQKDLEDGKIKAKPVVAPPKKVVVPARTVLKNSTPKAPPPKAAPVPSYGRAMPVPKTLVRPPVAPPRTMKDPQQDFVNRGGKTGGTRLDLPPGTTVNPSDVMLMNPLGMVGAGPTALSAIQKAIAKFFPKGVANVADDVVSKSEDLAQYSDDFANMMSEVKYREQLGRVGNPAEYADELGNSSRSFMDMFRQTLARNKYAKEFETGVNAVRNPKVINAGAKVSQDLTPAKVADFNLMQTANSGAKSLTAVELALRELASKGVTFPKALQKLTDAQAKKWMQGDISFSKVPPASKIPTVAKAIAAALGIPLAIGAKLGVDAIIEDQSNINARQEWRNEKRIQDFGEDENRFVRKDASAAAFKSSAASRAAAEKAVAAASPAPSAVAPSVSTSTDEPPTDPRL